VDNLPPYIVMNVTQIKIGFRHRKIVQLSRITLNSPAVKNKLQVIKPQWN